MTKADARSFYGARRNQLSPIEKNRFSDLILINFQKINWPFLHSVHTYLAREDELETELIIRYLAFGNPGLQVCVPKMNVHTGELDNCVYNDDTQLTINKFGIEEPVNAIMFPETKIDLVLLPLLAFDSAGNRVGYGKGYYDKFLKRCGKDVIKVGLSFFEPCASIEDTNQYDIPLNYCITPGKYYAFG